MPSLAADRIRQPSALNALALPRFAGPRRAEPRVIALEGPNGAGKSTLCRRLSQALGAPRCLGTDAAWFSPTFKTRMIRDAEWPASVMFFLSGCLEQMRLLRQRDEPLIIMDRSLWSTLAVQASLDPARLRVLLAMLRPIAPQIHVPALTLVLEASFAVCQGRIARKTGAARALDALTAQAAFHAREQEFYRWLGRQRPGVVFLNVDNLAPAEVCARAAALVRAKARC
jgi:thymidylate kinase